MFSHKLSLRIIDMICKIWFNTHTWAWAARWALPWSIWPTLSYLCWWSIGWVHTVSHNPLWRARSGSGPARCQDSKESKKQKSWCKISQKWRQIAWKSTLKVNGDGTELRLKIKKSERSLLSPSAWVHKQVLNKTWQMETWCTAGLASKEEVTSTHAIKTLTKHTYTHARKRRS